MKINTAYGFLFCCIISFSTQAQDKEVKYHSINLGGITAGESQVNSLFQTINGVSLSDWFFGVGIGIDYYQYKTLPLFFDARKFFGNKSKVFVYGNLGYNFPINDKPDDKISMNESYDFNGGIYTDFGLGVKTKFNKSTSLLFSLGHSYKRLKSKIGTTICPFAGPCYVDYNKYQFDYGRIILKAGLIF